jgi:FkbM family methyltransferase
MTNWPLVVPDKLGFVRTCRYRARSGLTVCCRARSTDINEAVAILSGLEYPARFLGIEDGSVVVDIGANIGSFALQIDALNRGINFRGIAFEPFSESFELLDRNLRANGIAAFHPVEAAVTNVDGWVHLWTDCKPDRVRVTGPGNEEDPAAARSYRLSTYCKENGIATVHLLKADVEGSEYDIVEADRAFMKAAVVNALIEYHELGGNRTFSRLVETMQDDFAITVVHERRRTGVFHARNRSLSRVLNVRGNGD